MIAWKIKESNYNSAAITESKQDSIANSKVKIYFCVCSMNEKKRHINVSY